MADAVSPTSPPSASTSAPTSDAVAPVARAIHPVIITPDAVRCADEWAMCSMNPWSIAKVMHRLYYDKLRYNEEIGKWEYFDTSQNQWKIDKKKEIVKRYFVYNSRIMLLKETAITKDEYDYCRYLHISNYISNHYRSVLKEAKEVFVF